MTISLMSMLPMGFDEFLAHYNARMREKSVESGGKAYRIAVASRFNSQLNAIWSFFRTHPLISVRDYTDTVFECASTVDECLPHRFLGTMYQRMYARKQLERCLPSDKENLLLAVRWQLEDVADNPMKWVSAERKMSDVDMTLEVDIRMGFPPESMLAISADYAAFWDRLEPEDRKKFVEPRSLSYIVPLARSLAGTIDRLNAIAKLRI